MTEAFEMTSELKYIGHGCYPFNLTDDEKGKGVLVETGTCGYLDKVLNAEDSGAGFVVLANPEGVAGFPGSGVFDSSTWFEDPKLTSIPVVGISYAIS